MEERALLLMRENGIEAIFVVSGGDPTADKVDAFEITRDDVAQDADTAALVFAWSCPGSVDGELLSRASLHQHRGG